MIGSRVGLRVGPKLGVAAGASADEIGADALLSLVTRDAASGKYLPSSATEWDLFLAALGSPLPRPHHLWLMQESSGNPADVIGGGLGIRNLTATTAANAPLYGKPIAGWTRKAIGGPGLAVNANLSNTSMVATASSSFLVLLFALSVQPLALRNICAYGSPLIAQPASAKTRLRLGGATTDTAADHVGAVHPYLFAYNVSASTCTLYSDLEKIVVPFSASAGSTLMLQCASTGDTTAADFLYAAGWDGVAGEISDPTAKQLLQGFVYSPPWS